MTAAKAIQFQGTLFKMGNAASPEVFNTIAELKSHDGPSGSATVIDASTTESTAKEKLMGLPDEGQFSISLNFDPTDTNGQVAMILARKARTLKNFQLAFPNSPSTVVAFSAYVMSFSLGGAVDGLIEGSATLEISGPVTGPWDV